MFTVICWCTSYNMLLSCTKYWEACHAYLLYMICYYTFAIFIDMNLQNWINISLFELFSYALKHVYEDPPWFVTRGSLIIDIAVSPCSIYLFLYLFSLFYSTVEPATGDKPGEGHRDMFVHIIQSNCWLYLILGIWSYISPVCGLLFHFIDVIFTIVLIFW